MTHDTIWEARETWENQGTLDTQEPQDTQETRHTRMAWNPRNTQNTRKTKDTQNVQNTEDTKDNEDMEYIMSRANESMGKGLQIIGVCQDMHGNKEGNKDDTKDGKTDSKADGKKEVSILYVYVCFEVNKSKYSMFLQGFNHTLLSWRSSFVLFPQSTVTVVEH